MNPDDQNQDAYTQVLVQLGVLQEGQRNTLAGIEEIKGTLSVHGNRIGTVESKVAVLESKVEKASPAKDHGIAIIAIVVAACAAALPLVQWLISL